MAADTVIPIKPGTKVTADRGREILSAVTESIADFELAQGEPAHDIVFVLIGEDGCAVTGSYMIDSMPVAAGMSLASVLLADRAMAILQDERLDLMQPQGD